MADTLNTALDYAGRGWYVLPCTERDKRPLTVHGSKDATLDPALIREWWQHWPSANIGIAGGHGLAIVDVDDMTALDVLAWLRLADTAAVATSRGEHFYFTTAPDLPTCKPWPGVDLRGSGSYVLAPPSIHPSGQVYTWLCERDPAPAPAELLALVGDSKPAATAEPMKPQHYISLPRLAKRILRGDPTTICKYASRSDVDRAFLVSLVNAGVPLERALALYTSSRHDKHLDPTKRDFMRRFTAEFLRAREFAAHDRPDVAAGKAQAQAVRHWAQKTPVIVSGNRVAQEAARRILIAHCTVVEQTGKDEWQMSVRDIATATKVSLKTIVKAHRRLIKAGLLRQVKPAYRDMAAMWAFGDVARSTTLTHTRADVRECSTSDTSAPDAFEAIALGRNIWQTYDALARLGVADVETLAKEAGWSIRTTERHVLALAAHGLAAALEDGQWSAVTSAKRLREVGAALGGTEAAKRRVSKIQAERKAFNRHLHESSVIAG